MYNHAPPDYVCPFCLIAQGVDDERVLSAQSDVICRDAWLTAFIGAGQWLHNPGNTIIIPNEHYENLYDLPLQYAPRLHELARAVALAMKIVYRCDGISTRQHNEPAGNQDVWHYHLHVTPRYAADNLYSTYMQRAQMAVEERAHHAALLRAQLAGWKPAS